MTRLALGITIPAFVVVILTGLAIWEQDTRNIRAWWGTSRPREYIGAVKRKVSGWLGRFSTDDLVGEV